MKTLFLPLMLIAISSFTAMAQPKAIYLERSKDAGTHENTETINVEYQVRNDGKESLFVYFVRTSCSCITVTSFDSIIEPGKTGRIKVNVDLAGQSGQIWRGLIVKTNDPVKSTVELTLSYTAVAKTLSSGALHHPGQEEEDWAIQMHPSLCLVEDEAW